MMWITFCSPRMFFFLIIRPAPRSTLFPYTTLFRSMDVAQPILHLEGPDAGELADDGGHQCGAERIGMSRIGDRSEEHTSELQSRENLVCRLLLEKKKKRSRQLIDVILLTVHRADVQ